MPSKEFSARPPDHHILLLVLPLQLQTKSRMKLSMVSVEGSLRWWDRDGSYHHQGRVNVKGSALFCGLTTSEGGPVDFGCNPKAWTISQHKLKSAHAKARVICIEFHDTENKLSRVQFTASVSNGSRDDGCLFYKAVLKMKEFERAYEQLP